MHCCSGCHKFISMELFTRLINYLIFDNFATILENPFTNIDSQILNLYNYSNN